MTEPLSALFDGELHWLEPDEHFSSDGSGTVLAGFEPVEDDDLSPFETAAEPLWSDKPANYKHDNKPANADLEQSWGTLSINLGAFCAVVGVEKKQYQHLSPDQTSRWSFQTTDHVTDRM